MRRSIVSAFLSPALAGLLFPAVPASAGWTSLSAPGFAEGTQFRDWRGMGAGRLVADESGTLYLYSNGTLYRSRAGGDRWDTAGSFPVAGAYTSHRYRPFVTARGDWLLCDRWLSTDRGLHWRKEPPALYGMMWLTVLPGNRFLGTRFYGAGLWISQDTGATFDNVGGMRPWYQDWADAGDGVYLAAGVKSTVPGMTSETVYSQDGGMTWNPLVKPSGDTVAQVRAFALAADPDPARKRIYALSDSAGGARLDILHTISSGFRVETRSALPGIPDSAVTCFRAAPLPGGGTRIWAGTWGDGLFASEDGGGSWRREDGLGDPRVADLAVSGETVYALTPTGVYREEASTAMRRNFPGVERGRAMHRDGNAIGFRGAGHDGGPEGRFRLDGKRIAVQGGKAAPAGGSPR